MNEVAGCTRTYRHSFSERLVEAARQPLRCYGGDFRIQNYIEVGFTQAAQVIWCCTEWGNDVDTHTHLGQKAGYLLQIVAVPKAQCGWTQNIATRTLALRAFHLWHLGLRQCAHQLIKSFCSTPVLLSLIRRKLQRNDGYWQTKCFGQPTRIVLNQLCRARRTNEHGLWLEAFESLTSSTLEKFGSVTTEVTRLKGRVSHWWPLGQPFNHGEQQVGISVALGRVQNIVNVSHRGSDAHGTDMRWAFISPERELHG